MRAPFRQDAEAFPDLPAVRLDTEHAQGKVLLAARDDVPAAGKRTA